MGNQDHFLSCFWPLAWPLLCRKGIPHNVDAPSGTSNPEGSDAGPGSRVPEEQLSQGRDSANVSGHVIPAVLCRNQYAVLFDAEPTENEILD